jgi:hypothetical protein
MKSPKLFGIAQQMSDLHDIMYAKAACWFLGIFGVVAIIAIAARRRLILLLGSVGGLLGLIVPQLVVFAQYRSTEAAFLGAINAFVDHTVCCSSIGSAGAFLSDL